MSINNARLHAENQNWSMAAVEAMPESVFTRLYPYKLKSKGPYWRLIREEDTWVLPRAKDALRITHIKDGWPARIKNKYLCGQIDVAAGDRVVDVGGMIGEFANCLPTDNVLSIDPDPRNARCLRINTDGDVVQAAAWCSDKLKTLSMADDTSESSLLDLDAGTGDSTEIQAMRLDSLITEPVDLLKIEAEGAEPEVLQGSAGVDAEQIVIDVSPERNGQSPAALCRAILEHRQYTVEQFDDVLYAYND